MSSANIFTIRKSSDENMAYGVRFLKKELGETPYVVLSCDVTATDAQGNDVTSTIIDDAFTVAEGNLVKFMTQGGVSEETYQIKVTATMSDGKTKPVAWGLLIVVDPILTEA